LAVLHLITIAVISYLLGSLPTSIIIGRLFFRVDIREKGSGNAGATNTFRVFGWKAGVVTILIDVGKAVVATLFVSQLPAFGSATTAPFLEPDAVRLIAGCSAVVGHIWTVFAGFRGGKGVGAAAGMVVSLYPVALLITVGIFALLVISTGIVSVGSIIAALLFPVIVTLLPETGIGSFSPLLFWFSIPLALLILFTHRRNIGRLLHGEENRFENLMLFRRLFRRSGNKRQDATDQNGQDGMR